MSYEWRNIASVLLMALGLPIVMVLGENRAALTWILAFMLNALLDWRRERGQ